ncbi:glycosyl hydrolase family 28 protein [Microbacterium paludicola]|uniref:glycosyl hydrolase family 28 protein n=1 Tax=Microbacterium paludicola TaxID=300019 RepID=UPI0031CF26E1
MDSANRRRRGMGVLATLALAIGLVVAGGAPAQAAPATIQPVPITAAHAVSTVYSLTVNGTPVPVNGYANYGDGYDYAEFAMGTGIAQITITKLDGTAVSKTYITPIKDSHVATHSGASSTFTISAPKYLIVKLDTGRRIIISAEAAETNVPAASGPGIFRVGSAAYPADPSGNTLSTTGVQAAINAASAYGTAGGTRGIVYVPAGVYTLANIELRSNIDVYFAPGSVWRMRADKSLYTVDAHKSSQNRDLTWWIQTEFGSENITMRGRGTLDGNGKAAFASGFGMNILAPIATSNFRLDGLTIREAASWAVIPTRSDDLEFTHMKIFNRFDMGENDGIDVIESQDVLVQYGIAIGHDDPYSTKSWPKSVGITINWPGDPEVVQNVAFDRLISWTGCFGFKVGQGVVSSHTDVRFTNSVIHDSSVGRA